MKEKLIQLVKERCLELGDFTLASGAKSNFYLDLKKLTLSGAGSRLISRMLHSRLVTFRSSYAYKWDFDAIGGPVVGADPLVGAFLCFHDREHSGTKDYLELRGFLIRKEEKDHGKAGRIIGSVKPGDRCVMLEDVTTSGKSVLEAVQVMENFGCEVVQIISVVDRMAGAAELFAQAGKKFTPILTTADLGV